MGDEPVANIRELLDLIESPTRLTLRQRLYRIVELWVMRLEIRVEAKTKRVWKESIRDQRQAVRVEH